ncbi:hypothetical protein ACVWU4_000984 [Campylobacter coli]
MFIKSLELHNYKRFFLSNIKTLTYKPNNPIQIIIGPNGVGKSQLLKELSPIPADINKNYNKDGYKKIEILHNNNTYLLTSNTKHSFLFNGVELNEGGTRKVQLQLVKEHFNLTPEVFEILLNNNKFTNMSPSERKKWLFECSKIDYTYSITVFNNLKSYIRDILGYIRKIQDDVIKMETLLDNSDTKIDKYKKDIENLECLLTFYKDNRNTINMLNNQSTFKDIDNNLIPSIRRILNNDSIFNIQELNKQLELLYKDKEHNNSKIKDINKQLSELDNYVNITNLNIINNKLQETQINIDKLSSYNFLNLDLNNYNIDSMVNSYKNIITNIIETINELRDFKYRNLYKTEYKNQSVLVQNIKYEINNLTNKSNFINNNIKDIETHLNNTQHTKCPICQHVFKPNEIEHKNKIEQYNKELELINKQLDIKQKELVIQSDKLEEFDNIDKRIKYIKELINNNPESSIIFKYLLTNVDIYTDSIDSVITFINSISIKLDYLKQLQHYIKIKNELLKEQAIAKTFEQKAIDLNKLKIETLEKELTHITAMNNNINKQIDILNNNINITNSFNNKIEELKKLNNNINNNFIKNLRNIYIDYLSELINIITEEYIIKVDEYNKLLSYKESIDKFKLEIEEKKHIYKLGNILLKELSPTEGLIAKSISSFINKFIEDINLVINNIWTYKVELLPSEVNEENDLDYRFRVKINDDEIIEDISKLSSSLQEIVNLAFRMVFCKYSKLDYPLYLDELGSTFDKAHRNATYNVIDKLLVLDYSQIFIVCHYENLYASFKNADFNVLSTNNIELESISNFNNTLKIE